MFLTRTGQPWVRLTGDETAKRSVIDSINRTVAKLGKRMGMSHPGGSYTLRYVLRTGRDEVEDGPTADMVMGHTDPTGGRSLTGRLSGPTGSRRS
jgi:hypothetical protein